MENRGLLHVRLKGSAESRVRSGHPWIFGDSIRDQNREGQAGELAVVFDRHDKFLAIGLYDPASPIRVRILHRGKPAAIDRDWWRARLHAALNRRRGLFDEATTGWRVLHGENDGWPGLVLDRYAGTFVLKLYSAVWRSRLDEISALFVEELSPERLVLRLSRNIAGEFQRSDGEILHGTKVEEPVVFLENGLRFEADVLRGQKTGFFLDQRENRQEIERLSQGRAVLNCFSFSGAFSLYAARGGAASVTDVDISAHALASSERNFALNPELARCSRTAIRADVFDWLKEQPQGGFDLAIVDPPSLARRESERQGAIRSYQFLNAEAIRLLRPGGLLAAASCSAHVSAPEFVEAVRASARRSGRPFEEIALTGHPPDHPADFPEAKYLKAIYLKFTE